MAGSLASLLEQSRQMASTLGSTRDIPYVELGLDQIESASRRLGGYTAGGVAGPSTGAGRMLVDGSEEGAAYLAAHGNVNYPFVSRTLSSLDPTAAFAPLQPLQDTDLEGHLRHAHEQTIISVIEEGRRATIDQFYASLESSMRRDWEKQKELVFEELGRHAASSNSTDNTLSSSRSASSRKGFAGKDTFDFVSIPKNGSQMRPKQVKYSTAVRRMNDYRKQGSPVGVVDILASAGTAGQVDARSAQLAEAWKLLSNIVNEKDVVQGEFQGVALQERQYAKAYLSTDIDTADSRDLQAQITSGGLAFLEEQFMQHVEKRLQAKPAEANLGGIPSIQNKIRGYISVQYAKNGQWPANLELANGQPVWARIFLLLRAGCSEEARQFAEENGQALGKLERGFVRYFTTWLESADGRLPRQDREAFVKDYLRRIKYQPDNNGDPFKYALYKLIGRMEPERRSVPGVTNTTEDWLWLQLKLVREQVEPGETASGNLRGLAKLLVKFGEKHFDPKGQRPLLYFQVLLLAGQFERAIAFLYGTSQYQVDAVHFGIALAYYGLLRVPAQAATSDVDILTTSGGPESLTYLNFSRILYRYYRQFATSEPSEALQYIYTICLSADAPAPVGDEQVQRCHAYLRELVMDTRAYAELLGDVRSDGTKVPGQIEKDLKLIHLRNDKDYLQGIVKAAAQRADQEKRFADTILLYNLAEEYDAVVQVLNAALGASLSSPNATAAESAQAQASQSFGMVDDVVSSARSILEHYDRSAVMLHRISKKARETCKMLLQLKDAFTLQQQNRLQEALERIEELSIIPLKSDLALIVRAADDLKEYDESILRNIDTILLNTMNILYKMHSTLKESPYGDSSRQETMNQLRMKARALMMFAGMLKYRLSGETYSQLTRLDVYLH